MLAGGAALDGLHVVDLGKDKERGRGVVTTKDIPAGTVLMLVRLAEFSRVRRDPVCRNTQHVGHLHLQHLLSSAVQRVRDDVAYALRLGQYYDGAPSNVKTVEGGGRSDEFPGCVISQPRHFFPNRSPEHFLRRQVS
eukprot:GHVU01213370.1.p1 GENE.GHVU01213370.1~~GHVU01213370.1.p1  ORF type:complete len:137 (-),score=14.77 GHVU01213370.1:760-1170(-)